ncbi:lipoprotein N-acyltransferase Lnb domain-containing protein [Spongiivirga citrea]|uniref:DUF4105 domain-containing protein n=1 Tax=Spongiivirga citrea TaxID=1481457 RepID=A0A6M0CPU5_9FLAO|nr:DUF4105 domain-containing protein [Spongiivirga citrea]NER15950.1 DUF4105 domain-containing protein [Spongiivirga citrea]
MKSFYIFFLLVCSSIFSFSQEIELSNRAEISILTGGPGDNLYTKFGHTAVRVKDTVVGFDVVFNYGSFDFDQPNFYLNFAKGRLLYKLTNYKYEYLERAYKRDNQSVQEQWLNLKQSQKQQFFNKLLINAKPQNSSYLYDYFYDNCATRPKDVLQQVLGNNLVFDETYVTDIRTIRQLYLDELPANDWGNLGITTALGSVIDSDASPMEHIYIPHYLNKALSKATIKTEKGIIPAVEKSETIIDSTRKSGFGIDFFWSPVFIFSALAFLGIFITYKDRKNNKRTKLLDWLIFSITGLIGVVLLLLWFATDHIASDNNFNILWAFTPNLLFLFYLRKNSQNWNKRYMAFLLGAIFLMLVLWVFGIQLFALSLIPILVLLLIRYVYLYQYFSTNATSS